MTTAGGRKTIEYLVRCALPNTRRITKVSSGVTYTFAGGIGLAPEWETGACGVACQELVSACMMAHVNTKGQQIGLWMVGPTRRSAGATPPTTRTRRDLLRQHLREPAGRQLLQRQRLQLRRGPGPARRHPGRVSLQEPVPGGRVLQQQLRRGHGLHPLGRDGECRRARRLHQVRHAIARDHRVSRVRRGDGLQALQSAERPVPRRRGQLHGRGRGLRPDRVRQPAARQVPDREGRSVLLLVQGA